MAIKINKKGNKEVEQYINDFIAKNRYLSQKANDYKLFAYDFEIPSKDEKDDHQKRSTFFLVNQKENMMIQVNNEIPRNPVKIAVKEGVDPITMYLHYIWKYQRYLHEVTLASWVNKYMLENFDAKCQLQFDNIGQMGDPESLFADDDDEEGYKACEGLEILFLEDSEE